MFVRAGRREIVVCEGLMKQFPVLSGTLTVLRHRQLHKLVATLGLTAVVACLAVPAESQAQNVLSRTGNAGLIVPVATTTLTALPDATIAVVTGMGLKAVQPVNGSAGSAPSIVLWDELRPTVQRPLIESGLGTVSVNGVMQ